MKNFKFSCLIVFLTLLSGAESLMGQAIFDTLNLKEFEVVDSYFLSGNTSRSQQIDSLHMTEFGQQDLGEMLSALTPAYVKSYGRGTMSTVSIRGAGAAHTQVLWEGFRLNSPMLGQVDFSQIPNALFTEVELLYGGSSMSNSAGAFGGSINLSSQNKTAQQDETIRLEQTAGSFNTWLTSLSVHLGMGKLTSKTNFIRQSSDNNFTYYNTAILPHEDMQQKDASFRNMGFMQQFDVEMGKNQHVFFSSWNQWSDRDLPPIMSNVYQLQEENQQDFTSRTLAGWKKTTQISAIEIKGAYFYEDYHYFLHTLSQDTSHSTVVLTDSKNLINSVFLVGNGLFELGSGFLLATQINLEYQWVESINYVDIKKRQTTQLMASLEKKWKEKLTMKLILRGEYSDEDYLPMLPYFGLNYQPFEGKWLSLRANISKNYKRPTLNELYFYPMGNENLNDESALETELGIDLNHHFGKQMFSAGFTAFYSSIDNYIQWLPSGFGPWEPSNIHSVLSRGVEVTLKGEGKVGNIRWTVATQYAYTHASESDSVVNAAQLPYIPRYQANGFLSASYHQYFMRWSTTYVGERSTTLNNEPDLPYYCLHHVTLGKNFALNKLFVETRLKIYNVFDIDYQAVRWRAMPGRYAEISVKIIW